MKMINPEPQLLQPGTKWLTDQYVAQGLGTTALRYWYFPTITYIKYDVNTQV